MCNLKNKGGQKRGIQQQKQPTGCTKRCELEQATSKITHTSCRLCQMKLNSCTPSYQCGAHTSEFGPKVSEFSGAPGCDLVVDKLMFISIIFAFYFCSQKYGNYRRQPEHTCHTKWKPGLTQTSNFQSWVRLWTNHTWQFLWSAGTAFEDLDAMVGK